MYLYLTEQCTQQMVERLQNAAGNLAENEGMEGMEGGGMLKSSGMLGNLCSKEMLC